MTELQFLIDLLLNHKLSAATKKIVADRIGDVELSYQPQQTLRKCSDYPVRTVNQQAPSTQRILDEMAPTPPVATTVEAAQALQSRNDAIRKAVNSGPFGGKPDPGRTSPRKF